MSPAGVLVGLWLGVVLMVFAAGLAWLWHAPKHRRGLADTIDPHRWDGAPVDYPRPREHDEP